MKFSKRNLFLYSAGLGLILQFPLAYFALLYSRSTNNLSASDFPVSELLNPDLGRPFLIGFVQATIFIFLFWLFVRWVASTAEKAGRSYLAFMMLAILMPLIAWIIVILFKRPEPTITLPYQHREDNSFWVSDKKTEN
jgi:hypothetical protein